MTRMFFLKSYCRFVYLELLTVALVSWDSGLDTRFCGSSVKPSHISRKFSIYQVGKSYHVDLLQNATYFESVASAWKMSQCCGGTANYAASNLFYVWYSQRLCVISWMVFTIHKSPPPLRCTNPNAQCARSEYPRTFKYRQLRIGEISWIYIY